MSLDLCTRIVQHPVVGQKAKAFDFTERRSSAVNKLWVSMAPRKRRTISEARKSLGNAGKLLRSNLRTETESCGISESMSTPFMAICPNLKMSFRRRRSLDRCSGDESDLEGARCCSMFRKGAEPASVLASTILTPSLGRTLACSCCCFPKNTEAMSASTYSDKWDFSSLPYPQNFDIERDVSTHKSGETPRVLFEEAKCEDIEPVDVIWSRDKGDPIWRCIVFAWENLAKIYSGEFMFGSDTVGWVESADSCTELIVMRNERLKQVLPIERLTQRKCETANLNNSTIFYPTSV